ncbi:MAG: DUF4097 family beta strand repeat protein [Lachnospiraceae bacterium]|nr:DUF4097 family beta strand repeat protein [Lachnospiraceae bacterium]
MKGFIKGCGIIVLFLLGAGLALTIAGCALGGPQQITNVVRDVTDGKVDINLDSNNWGINIGGVSSDDVKDALKGIMDNKIYNMDDFGSVFNNGKETLSGDVEKYSIDAAGVEKLRLDIGGCELTIKESDDDNFWVEAKNVQKFQAYVDGETLRVVNTSKEKSLTGLNIKNVKITLYLPTDFTCEKAEVELGAGILLSDSFVAEKAEFKIGAGELKLGSMDCDEMEIEVGAGNVEISNANVDKLNVKIGAGNMSFDGTVYKDAKVKCSLGNINLKLKNEFEDFNYKVECALGNIKLNGKQYSGLAKEEKIDHGADQDMKLECATGNIEVMFE